MRVHTREPRRARIEMLPLIDIVFLLLVFFIYAMLSMALHRGMPVLLPVSTASEIDRRPALSLTVQADGGVFLDRTPVPLRDLTRVLAEKFPEEKVAGVLLFADRALPYQALYGVLDRIRAAGISRISLQSEAESSR